MSLSAISTGISTGLSVAAKAINFVKDNVVSYYGNTSLPEVTKLARVEPITIVSKDLLNDPETRKILNSLLSIFAAHYLQAVDILTKVEDVEVVRILDSLNPDRDEMGFLLSEKRKSSRANESFQFISTENYQFRLPTYSRPVLESSNKQSSYKRPKDLNDEILRLEEEKKKFEKEKEQLEKEKEQFEKAKEKAKSDKEKAEHEERLKNIKNSLEKLEEQKKQLNLRYQEIGSDQDINLDTLANLSIGKLINVKIAYSRDDQPGNERRIVTIPINFRLMVSSIPNESIVRIMTYKSEDLSLIERIHSARSGRIEFIRDLIFCQDLIDEYKKAVIQDSSNVLQEIVRRANNAKKYGILTKNPSLVSASTLMVITDAVAREVESRLGGKLDNPRTRNKAFENTYTMIMVVVSKEWETATFYTRGIARGSTFSFKELDSKAKGTGPDIGDILKAMMSGQPPSF